MASKTFNNVKLKVTHLDLSKDTSRSVLVSGENISHSLGKIARWYKDISWVGHTHSSFDSSVNKGAENQPVYILNGVPTAIAYTIKASVPENAVFTDTNTKVTSVGNHYTPSGGTTTSASGGSLTDITNSANGVQVVTGVTKDAAGHVTGVTSIALKSVNSNTTYAAGTGISMGSGNVINHANSITAVTTAAFKKFTYDAQGHITGTAAVAAADLPSHTHTKSNITDFPTSLPASDVYSWAKAATKPTYTASEVGAAAASHTHSYAKSESVNGPAYSVAGTAGTTEEYRHVWFSVASGSDSNRRAYADNFKYEPSLDTLKFGAWYPVDITGQTVDLNTYTDGSGKRGYRRFICRTTGGGANISNKPSDSPFALEVILIRFGTATTDFITKQIYHSYDKKTYQRFCVNNTWDAWTEIKTTDANTTYTFATGDNSGSFKVTPSGGSASNIQIAGIKHIAGDSNGHGIIVQNGGLTMVGAGESATALQSALGLGGGTENLYLASDNNIYLYANCQTIANRKYMMINTSAQLEGGTGGSWIAARASATVKNTSGTGTDDNAYHPVISCYTNAGEWSIGTLGAKQGNHESLYISYTTNTNYTAGTNTASYYRFDTDGTYSGKAATAGTADRATNSNNCKTTVTDPSSSTTYGVVFVVDPNTSEDNTLRKSNDFRINHFRGAANTEGLTELVLGNSTDKTAANNSTGRVTMWGNNGYAAAITNTNTLSANQTVTMPNLSGVMGVAHYNSIGVVTRGADSNITNGGYWAGMTTKHGYTGVAANKWRHVLSMDWSGSDLNNWQSQLLIPTQDSYNATSIAAHTLNDGIAYRTNPGGSNSITSGTWITLIDTANYKTFITPANIGSAASSHNHGLLHDSHAVSVDSTTNTWKAIGINGEGYVLKSIRTNTNAPAYLLNNFSAGIAFGGADTRGVISMSYDQPQMRFAGGNRTKQVDADGNPNGTAVWHFTVKATHNQTYTLPSTGGTLALVGDNNHSHSYLPLSGGTLTGNLMVQRGATEEPQVTVNNGSVKAGLLVGSGKVNRGLYDFTTSQWMVYHNGTSVVLNGNANTATKLATARTINGVSFDGSANITVPRSIKHIHYAVGTNGTGGYVKICTVGTSGAYGDQPLRITLGQRKTSIYDIFIVFENSGSAKATIRDAYFRSNRLAKQTPQVHYYLNADGYYDIYVTKTEVYDHIYIMDYIKSDGDEGNQVSLTWTDTLVSTLPTGSVAMLNEMGQYYGNGSRTANTVLAAPNGSAGAATFRALVAADLPASGATAGSYGPSANASPAHSGTFSVPYLTVDAKGRVTAISTKTITLPASGNTDSKVRQSSTTTANYRGIVLGYTNNTDATTGRETDVTNETYITNKIFAQPSTGTLWASNLNAWISGTADVVVGLIRSGNSSWRLINSSGALYIQNNYYSSKTQSWYNVMKFNYDSTNKIEIPSPPTLTGTNRSLQIGYDYVSFVSCDKAAWAIGNRWMKHDGTTSILRNGVYGNADGSMNYMYWSESYNGTANTMRFYKSANGLVTSCANGFRIVAGGYGTFFRNDGTDFYLLLTDKKTDGTEWTASWNGKRPFKVSLSSGLVEMANGLLLSGGITFKTANASSAYLIAYDTGNSYNQDVVFQSTGSMIIGAGESAAAIYTNNVESIKNSENMALGADGDLYIYTHANAIASRRRFKFSNSGNFGFTGYGDNWKRGIFWDGATSGTSDTGTELTPTSTIARFGAWGYAGSFNTFFFSGGDDTEPYATVNSIGIFAGNGSVNGVNSANGTLKKRRGVVGVHNGTDAYYACIAAPSSLTTYVTCVLPSTSGTLALEGHTHSYLPLSGGTLTGGLTLATNQYSDSGKFGINCKNSDIININVLKFGDLSDSADEGIQFYRDGTKLDVIWAKNGVMYFTPNHTQGSSSSDTNYTVYHSGNLTLSTLGGAASSHTHSYLPLSGGTMSGTISSSVNTDTYINGNKGTNAIINSTSSAGAYVMLVKMNSTNGYFTHGTYQTRYELHYTAKSTVDAGTNAVTKNATLLDESGNASWPGTITAASFSGNATSATTATTANRLKWGFINPENSDAASKPWFRIAYATGTGTYTDFQITLLVSNYYGAGGQGILKLRARTEGTAGQFGGSRSIVWTVMSGFALANFKLITKNNYENNTAKTGAATVELWVKNETRYNGLNFVVLTEGYRSGYANLWKFTGEAGVASIPTTGKSTEQDSTLLSIANRAAYSDKGKTAVTDPSSNTSYGVVFVADPDTSEDNTLCKSKDFRLNHFRGAANTEGIAEIVLGNNVAKTAANNSTGYITFYNSKGYYAGLIPGANTANITVTLPAATGTLALAPATLFNGTAASAVTLSASVTGFTSLKIFCKNSAASEYFVVTIQAKVDHHMVPGSTGQPAYSAAAAGPDLFGMRFVVEDKKITVSCSKKASINSSNSLANPLTINILKVLGLHF